MAAKPRHPLTACLCAALCGVIAVADAPAAPPSPTELASTLRQAIGFGATDVLPAVAGDANHRQMIALASAFVTEHQAQLTPLFVDLRAARKELTRCLTWGEDPTAARQELQDARQAMVAAISDLVSGLAALVPPAHQNLVPRVIQNRRLDPDVRVLDLSQQQRQAILQAQRDRNGVLKNARNWHKKSKNEAAKAAFESTLQSILTPQQRTALQQARQVLYNRRLAMAMAEVEALQ